jgi:endonuclease/exonuclease/phosphatase family metal-dependent hydrolase
VGSTLRLVTANLLNGRADAGAFADLLRRSDADVVAVQELGWEQAEAIARVLPYGQLDPADDYTGMGLALRRPPADQKRLPLPYRDARIARLHPSDWPVLAAELEIVNVHFAAPMLRGLRRQIELRQGQVAGLARYFDEEAAGPRALVGDFNATPLWPVYRAFSKRFEDLVQRHARATESRLRATWPAWWPTGPLLRIDHCFGQGLEAEAVCAIPIPGSDHFALVIDLRAK